MKKFVSRKKRQKENTRKLAIIVFLGMLIIAIFFYKPYFFENNPKNLRLIGITYLKKKNYIDASKSFNKALIKDKAPINKYYLGYSLIQSGFTDEGLELLTEAKKLKPNNPSIYLAFGDYYFSKNDNKKALENYKTAYEKGANAKVYYKLGVYYLNTKETQKAYDNLIRSYDLDPDNLDLYPYLAEVYTRKGLFISAFDAYDHYIREKCKEGIPYSYMLNEEYEVFKKKMKGLRDLAGEI
ncbi:MAG: tetratricopeptide repeat protein [Vampirovibrionia bacterium]